MINYFVMSAVFIILSFVQVYLRQVPGSLGEQRTAGCLPQCDFFVFGVKPRPKGLVIGANILVGFTTVFDRTSKRLGFSKSTCNCE